MKKLIAVVFLSMVLSSMAHAGWNFNFWGSDDHQKKNQPQQSQPVDPNNPTSVPEPMTLILLGAGLIGIAMTNNKIKK